MKWRIVGATITVALVFFSAQPGAAGGMGESANVTVPAAVSFFVYDIAISTSSSNQSVSATDISTRMGRALRISLRANAENFTPPVAAVTTWSASNISWNAATWDNGTGVAGTLSSTAYAEVAHTGGSPSSTSTTNLVFTLAAKSTISRAGEHSLSATWKFESF